MATRRHEAALTGVARGRLPSDLRAGLDVIARVARALVREGTLAELSKDALAEMRDALGLEIAALYLPTAEALPTLECFVSCGDEATSSYAKERLSFEDEAWTLAVAGGRPLIFQEEGSWVVENPFEPAAQSWLVLPLLASKRLVGVVMAAGPRISLDPVATAVVTLLGDLLTAGIANATLRQEVQRTQIQRERLRLAAEIHEGLAQDLALASRELKLLDSGVSAQARDASWARLQGAIASAHRTLRTRLADLSSTDSASPLEPSVAEVRSPDQRVAVRFEPAGLTLDSPPEIPIAISQIVSEAVANVEKHAGATNVSTRWQLEEDCLTFTVEDNGCGFDTTGSARPQDDHFGLRLMHERAHAIGASLEVTSEPGAGTRVVIRIPVA